jgi:hypothetical protein
MNQGGKSSRHERMPMHWRSQEKTKNIKTDRKRQKYRDDTNHRMANRIPFAKLQRRNRRTSSLPSKHLREKMSYRRTTNTIESSMNTFLQATKKAE